MLIFCVFLSSSILLWRSFIIHEVDEEARPEDHGLHPHVQVEREVDVVVVRLARGRHQAVPLPDDAAGAGGAIDASDLKHRVRATATGATRPADAQHFFLLLVLDAVRHLAHVPVVPDEAQGAAGRTLHLQLLPSGGTTEATAGASEGPLHRHDFPAHGVRDPEDEGPQRPVSVPGEVVCVLSHKVHHLAQVVFNIVFVINFKTCYQFQRFKMLKNMYVVQLG